ncbi:MAG: hypothetical protein ACPIOQ_26540 [Promethearchaeia archaeon]
MIGDKPPKESIRAVVIFGSAEDAETFCVKACGARLKGRLPFFGIKTAGQLRYPSGRVPRRPRGAGGAEGVVQAGDEDDGEVEEGDAVEREGVSRGEQGSAHAQKEVVKFGALFDSLLGGGGLLGDVEGGDVGQSGDAGGAAAASFCWPPALLIRCFPLAWLSRVLAGTGATRRRRRDRRCISWTTRAGQ